MHLDDRSGTSYGNHNAKSSIDFAADSSFPYSDPSPYDADIELLDAMLDDPLDIDKFVKKINAVYIDVDPYTPSDKSALAGAQLRMYESPGRSFEPMQRSGGIDKTMTIAPGRSTGTKRGFFSRPPVDVPASLVAVMRLYDIPTDDERALIGADLARYDAYDDDFCDTYDEQDDISQE